MIRIGPITIIRSKVVDAYRGVVRAAWPLHQTIWFDQQHDYSELMPLDADLAGALSYVPAEDAPTAKPERTWEIQPTDIHWNGSEASFIVKDQWEPFGVLPVPNTLDPNQVRLWTRRPVDHKKRKSFEIKIQSAGWGGHEVVLHLTAHWEPFGVSDSAGNHIIWFRREASS